MKNLRNVEEIRSNPNMSKNIELRNVKEIRSNLKMLKKYDLIEKCQTDMIESGNAKQI